MARRTNGNSWGGLAQIGTRPKGGPPTKGSNPGAVYQPGAGGPGFAPGTGPDGMPPPAVPAQPVDPWFEQQKISSGRVLQVGTARDAWDSANLDYDSGFGADQSNPYSRAKLLEESWKRSKLGTTNNYASSGQLHSGAYGRMQGENDRNYSIGVHEGKRDLARGQQGIAWGGLERGAEYGIGMTQGDWDALMNAFKTKFG